MPSTLFLTAAKNRSSIITGFKLLYVFTLIFTVLGIISLYRFDSYAMFFLKTAETFGQGAVLLYIATLIPGIFRRFRWHNEVVALLMMYRRYIGILMFLFVFAHAWFRIGVEVLKGYIPFPMPLNLLMGSSAEMLLIILAFTSNDWATKRLGIWWSRIHSLTYIILWFIFIHIALVEAVSVWTVLLGSTGIAVIISHMYKRFHR